VTFGDTSWLLLGAAIGVVAACAIPYGMVLIARIFRTNRNVDAAK
jgi:hypothetical protein